MSTYVILLLSGCGFSQLQNRATNPAILDIFYNTWPIRTKYEIVSTDASRRTIFVRYGYKGIPEFVCAEPSPDALAAYAQAAATAAKGGNGEVSAELSFNNTFSTSAAPLLYRSQGLQMLRDQTFNLCIMLMNKTISSSEYLNELDKYTNNAVSLIKSEQKAVEIAAARPVVVVSPPSEKPDGEGDPNTAPNPTGTATKTPGAGTSKNAAHGTVATTGH